MSRHPTRAVALAFALVAAPASAHARQSPPSPAAQAPQLVVTGFGEVTIAPDRAHIDVAMETCAATAAQSAAQNARRVRVVMDTLRARGIAAGELATLGYSVNPDYQHTPRGEPLRRGYVATSIVRIETRSLDEVGALIDAALAAGANRVNEVRFSSTRHAAVRDSATALAIANARRTAETMARAAGATLGELVELSSEVNPFMAREALMRNRMGYAGGVAASTQNTAIAPDDLMVGAAIVARWRLIGGR